MTLGLSCTSETSKPSPSDRIPPTGSYCLIVPLSVSLVGEAFFSKPPESLSRKQREKAMMPTLSNRATQNQKIDLGREKKTRAGNVTNHTVYFLKAEDSQRKHFKGIRIRES